MANAERGEIGFEVGGSAYVLRYSTNAICELEDAIGLQIPAIIEMMQAKSGIGLKPFRSIFWAGLTDKQPDMTVKEAGELIDSITLAEASALVGRAMEAAFPAADGARPQKGGRVGSGKNSSSALSKQALIQ